jgi:hypothetical protein
MPGSRHELRHLGFTASEAAVDDWLTGSFHAAGMLRVTRPAVSGRPVRRPSCSFGLFGPSSEQSEVARTPMVRTVG